MYNHKNSKNQNTKTRKELKTNQFRKYVYTTVTERASESWSEDKQLRDKMHRNRLK